ncbi:helix-turn-helix domain-containing protein [Sphingomonas sp. R-74633]|uniref:XRE family transcriptional regulator n=1 Tax=Sphingomonas sp. R-74633 TaxID=2751188 RepID=UPI0015D107AA|nr:LexA family transcriptional regulator [Sphingomonas sp. R-74633]NYT43132.1 helix-turn-helix domain-containing protein [Sphingomonas sp. R-74633]
MHSDLQQHHNGVAGLVVSTPIWRVASNHRIGVNAGVDAPNNLAALREEKGWSRPKLAELMNTSPQQVERLEKGQRKLTQDWMIRAGEALGVDPSDIMGGTSARVKSDAQTFRYEGSSADRPHEDLPIYGTVLGAPKFFEGEAIEQTTLNSGDVVGYLKRPPLLNGRGDVYGLYVVSNSMWPVYPEGSTIVAEGKRPARIGDDVVAYLRPENEEDDGERARAVIVKRLVRRTAEYYEFEQFNPAITFRLPRSMVLRIDRVLTFADLLS